MKILLESIKVSDDTERTTTGVVSVSYEGLLPSDRPVFIEDTPEFKKQKRDDSALIRKALKSLIPGLEDVHVSFSAKAGCSCGCSPGFVLKGRDNPFLGKWVFVSLVFVPEEGDEYNPLTAEHIVNSPSMEVA